MRSFKNFISSAVFAVLAMIVFASAASADSQYPLALTGLAPGVDGGWYYFQDGSIQRDYTGLIPNEWGWWRVQNGKVDFHSYGVYSNEWGWWFVKGGMVDFSYTGIAPNEWGWWRVVDGRVDFTASGVFQNEYGLWYVQNGMVDFSFSGKAETDRGTYEIENGAAKAEASGKTEYEEFLASVTEYPTKEEVVAAAVSSGLDENDAITLIGWVQGEGYFAIGDPYLTYLSACVIVNGVKDGIYGSGGDLADVIYSWGSSYYAYENQYARYENACDAALIAVYHALIMPEPGIYFCRGSREERDDVFYDPDYIVQGQHLYVW